MGTVHGRLTAAVTSTSFTGFRVTASFGEKIVFSDAPSMDEEPVVVSATRVAAVSSDGTFAFDVPADDKWAEPLTLTATTPNGTTAGSRTATPSELGQVVELAVTPAVPTSIDPSTDPTYGRRERLIGRVLDPDGSGGTSDLLVVIWGIPPGGAETDAFPAVIAETTTGGYFAAEWPPAVLSEAWAVLSGRDKVPIALGDHGRLPRRVVLLATNPTEHPPADHSGEDCACDAPLPPRAPDPADVASNPEVFAADKGGCVDMTVPNRALEEVSFHTVVRTTQPEIKGVMLPNPNPVPTDLVRRLAELATSKPTPTMTSAPAFSTANATLGRSELPLPSGTSMPRGGRDVVGVPDNEIGEDFAVEVVRARTAVGSKPLALHATVLADLTRDPAELTATKLLRAERVSLIRDVRDVVSVLSADAPGRVALDATHIVDWDDTPTTYQATTIAHGHLLTFK